MKNPFRHRKEVCLIKKAKATTEGWEYTYFTEIDGIYISGSIFNNSLKAEEFFERVLRLEGEVERREVLRKEKL